MCCREGTLNEDGGRGADTHKPARCGHTGSWSFCIVITQLEVDTPAVLRLCHPPWCRPYLLSVCNCSPHRPSQRYGRRLG
jgi:hypothetical protein